MAPPGTLGGTWCSGARGTRVSVCGALRPGRDSTQCIRKRLVQAEVATVSAIEHPADGATGDARGRLVLRCSWHACERVRRAQTGPRLTGPSSSTRQRCLSAAVNLL